MCLQYIFACQKYIETLTSIIQIIISVQKVLYVATYSIMIESSVQVVIIAHFAACRWCLSPFIIQKVRRTYSLFSVNKNFTNCYFDGWYLSSLLTPTSETNKENKLTKRSGAKSVSAPPLCLYTSYHWVFGDIIIRFAFVICQSEIRWRVNKRHHASGGPNWFANNWKL